MIQVLSYAAQCTVVHPSAL